jgi:hypothetical protein
MPYPVAHSPNRLLVAGGPQGMHRLEICVSRYYRKPSSPTHDQLKTTPQLETQVIVAALIENFEFYLPPHNEKTKIYRKPTGLMVWMTGAGHGTWMGLVVKSGELSTIKYLIGE